MTAPWASAQPQRPSRVWHVSRRAASPTSNSNLSRWEPSPKRYLRGASSSPVRLREAGGARAEGLRPTRADESWNEPYDPAMALTPHELAERQAQRSKLALLRSQREQAIAREAAALRAEKRAYANALGRAASSQAIESLRQERSAASERAASAAKRAPGRRCSSGSRASPL